MVLTFPACRAIVAKALLIWKEAAYPPSPPWNETRTLSPQRFTPHLRARSTRAGDGQHNEGYGKYNAQANGTYGRQGSLIGAASREIRVPCAAKVSPTLPSH
jgi:hypothetical protein